MGGVGFWLNAAYTYYPTYAGGAEGLQLFPAQMPVFMAIESTYDFLMWTTFRRSGPLLKPLCRSRRSIGPI